MSLRTKGSGLYRFVAGAVASWAERAVEEQDALDALRTHPGMAQLRDVLDGEERALFRRWRALPAGDPGVADLHAEARAWVKLTTTIHRSVNQKHDAEEAEAEIKRQIDLMKVDSERTEDVRERLARHTQRMRNGAASPAGARQ